MFRLPTSLLLLSLPLLLLQPSPVSAQTLVSRLILDSDPSVDYEPADFWHSSNVPCPSCPTVAPSLTLNGNGTYHNGTHFQPFIDPDDLTGTPDPTKRRKRKRRPILGKRKQFGKPTNVENEVESNSANGSSSTTSSSPASSSSSSSPSPSPSPTPTPTPAPSSSSSSSSSSSKASAAGSSQSVTARPVNNAGTGTIDSSNPNFTTGPDADDPNFIPDTVTVTFRFIGQSAQLHALIPTFAFPSMISNTNVSFTLDGISTGPPFTFTPQQGSPGPTSFASRIILNVGSLKDGPHVLVASLAPMSILLVDYLNYTAWDTDPLPSAGLGQGTTTVTTVGHELTGGATATPVTKHNIMTFGLAVGLSVGVLGTFSICLWLSIWRRRRNSRRRLKMLEEEEAANARRFGLDPDEVRGPIPFVPRYFPGTVHPSPPPYEPDNTDPPMSPLSLDNNGLQAVTLLPPETSQVASSPLVSIASRPRSMSVAASGTGTGVSVLSAAARMARRSSLQSTGSVIIPFSEDDQVASSMPTHPGLVMPIPRRTSPPPAVLLSNSGEGEREAAEEEEPEQVVPRRISRSNSRRQSRREDQMSDTESKALLHASASRTDLSGVEGYRDEPIRPSSPPVNDDDNHQAVDPPATQ